MNTNMPPLPNSAAIQGGAVVEGLGLDFKQEVGLEIESGTTKLVDDVVATLTAVERCSKPAICIAPELAAELYAGLAPLSPAGS